MKRFISLSLVVLMLCSLFNTTAFAAIGEGAFGGAAVSNRPTESTRIVYKPGAQAIKNPNDAGGPRIHNVQRPSQAVRLRAVPVKSPLAKQDYFTCDESGKIIYELSYSDLVKAPGYNQSAGWHYYVDYFNQGYHFGDSWGTVVMFSDGHAEKVEAGFKGSSDYTKLVNIFAKYGGSKSTDLNDAKQLSDMFRIGTDSNLSDAEKDQLRYEVGIYFGLSESEAKGNYYIVAEQLLLAGFQFRLPGGYGIDWSGDAAIESFGKVINTYQDIAIGMSHAVYHTDPGVAAGLGFPTSLFDDNMTMLGFGLVESRSGKWYGEKFTSGKYTWMQEKDHAPWEHEGYKMGDPIINGYSLYGFGQLSPASKAGGNIAVEYDGDVNTSDPGKFKSTGSLVDKGVTTDNAYWDFQQSKWVDSSDSAQLLKFTGKIDMTEEYALCFTGKAKHNINGGDIKLEPTLRGAFEDSPGDGYTSSSLRWGKELASGGSDNVGFVWKVMTLDGYANVAPIKTRFETAFNGAQSYGQLSTVQEAATTDKYKSYEILEGSWRNANEGFELSSDKVLERDLNGKYTFKKDEQLGMGYEFIIRGTPVKSREITLYVTADADNKVESVSSAQTWEEDYTTAKNVLHDVTEEDGWDFCGWVVVPKQNDIITSSIESSLNSAPNASVGTLLNAAKSGASGGPVEASSPGATILGIGSTLDSPPEGYTVYKILRQGTPVVVTGTVVLPAYMLNRYFNNIIQTSSQIAGNPEKFTLAKDWTWVSWTSYAICCKGHNHGPNGYKDDWVHEYRDTASSQEFALDNAMIDRYYPKGTGNWSGAQRSKLYGHGWTQAVDTRNISETSYVVDYAFNLVRNNTGFGDARSISGISYRSYVSATGDSSNLLRISSQFGVVPAVVKRASPSRNSVAALATYTETFNIESRFQHDGSPRGNHVKSNPWSCTHSHGSGENRYTHTVSGIYYTLQPVTIKGFYGIASGYSDKITYQFTNTAFKYSTKDDLGKGQNDFLGSAQSKPLSTGRRNSTAGSITPSNFYRFTTVRYSGVDLLFHPENYMVFKIGGTEFSAINAQNYVKAYVMSEVRRTSRASGMYFFRLNADITSVPGTVYSDSMQGGTGIYGLGDTVSIPAGADVTVAADPTGVAIDLYGYVLDIVQEEDDGKIGAVGAGRAYNSVVANGDNAYQKWGNNSRDKIKQHFVTWCNDMLKVENYAADFKLYVNSGLKSENFSATIGSVEAGSAGVVEEGIYQLVVEKGVLQTSKGDYSAMLDQIATDYGCSRGEAESMFRESAIYTAIINGMETCLNPKNNSNGVLDGLTYTPDIKSQWTNDLGGNGNWYDEVSRTFVIRRFTNLGNKLCDVIATDKIDYQLAPDGQVKPGENVNANVSYDARWELNIFFDQNAASQVNDLLLGSSRYYDPQNGSTGFDPANRAYSVLFNSIPVANADFKIPASSTQDFYN